MIENNYKILYLQMSVLRQGGLGMGSEFQPSTKKKRGKKIQEEEGDEIH